MVNLDELVLFLFQSPVFQREQDFLTQMMRYRCGRELSNVGKCGDLLFISSVWEGSNNQTWVGRFNALSEEQLESLHIVY